MTNRSQNIETGRRGEVLGFEYLERSGYRILEKNYRTKLGEIDCVAQHEGTLVFVEIKTRRGPAYGLPQEAVNYSKQQKLVQCARYYLQVKSYNHSNSNSIRNPIRFDVLAVIINELQQPAFELIKNAIEL